MQCIQAFEPVTLEKIAEKTLLSRPTILEIINSFKEEGIVVNGGFRESTGGRPPQLLCINGDSAYAIGIDFEFPTIRIALANAKREIVGRRKILFKIDTQAEEVLARMLRELEHLLEEFSSVRPRIVGIGVGICGTIRKTEGRSLHITRIRGWEHVELQRILQEKFHLPVYVNNDVHLLALVEKKKYMREDNSDFVYIGIRSGIGSAYMYQNKLMDGVQGNAGYIGHTVLNAEGPMCVCGNRGCLDAYAGELALNRRYQELTNSENESYYTMRDFMKLSRNGDAVSQKILKDAAFYLGITISNLIKILEPKMVLIASCEPLKGTTYWNIMEETIKKYCKDHNQPAIETRGQLVRCIFESLALRYRQVLENLQRLSPNPIEVLHVIGGGSRNDLLNQWTANAIGIPVIAGPSEATAIGNIMIQAVAAGQAADIASMRQLLSHAIHLKTFYPEHKETWDVAYLQFKTITQ